MMKNLQKRLLASLLALSMTGGTTLPVYAAAEPDLALENAFGTSDCELIAQEAAEDLVEKTEEDASEPEDASSSEEPNEEEAAGGTSEEQSSDTDASDSEESTESGGEEETAQLELRWEKDGAYVESADACYVYTGEAIQPEYQLWDAEAEQAVTVDYAEAFCLDAEGTESAQQEDFINCGTVYLFLYEKDENGSATGESVASGYFTITPAEQSITGLEASYTQKCGTTLTLTPMAQGTLTYSSSDEGIVSVDESGVLSFLTGGTAVITIAAAATENYRESVVTAEVTAEKLENEVATSKSTYTVKYSKDKTFSLEAQAAGDGTITYKSSDTSVVEVSSTGVCTLVGIGKATVTVTAKATSVYTKASTSVSVVSYRKAKTLSYSKSYKKGKYYKALMALKLTGGKRADTVAIALSQLGYHEGKSKSNLSGKASGEGNYTEYGRYYGLTCGAWCAMFVNWCAREAGVSTKVIPKYCAVRNYYSYYHKSGRKFYSWKKIRSGSYKPKKGDLIMYANVKGGTAHHIGFVISASYSGKKVTIVTVEGNTKDQVRKVTMKLKKSGSGKINGHYILGVAHPNY